jgi:hypothetical protein
MTKRLQKFGFALILLTLGLSSCVNLKHVNDFSSTSLKSLKKFEDINYSFKQNCLDNCQDNKIHNLNLNAEDCDCVLNDKADSVTLLIYSSLRGYLDGLTNLSNNDLTSYKMDALTKALTEGKFGSITIEKEQVEAYSKISKILLKAFTDGYRKKKIKEYVKEANEPLKVLITFLDFNLSANLVGKLNVQKGRIKSYYFDLTKDPSLSTIEKTKAAEQYYSQLSKIEAKQNELLTYSKAIKKVVDGHQKLTENIEKMTKAEIKELLTQYASDIQDIISEFNKIKK